MNRDGTSTKLPIDQIAAQWPWLEQNGLAKQGRVAREKYQILVLPPPFQCIINARLLFSGEVVEKMKRNFKK